MSITTDSRTLDVGKLPPERAITKLIDYAQSIGASDLFLGSTENHVAVQMRHLGIIRPLSDLPQEVGRKIIAHIRATSGMDTSERRKPADGRWIYRDEDGPAADLRISTIPTVWGEDLAIRLISHDSKLFTLENLGLIRQQRAQLETLLDSPGGLILLTGPTGSGKTATQYACLAQLNNGKRKINTIEDPIEHSIPGLHQSQVNLAIGLGFSELLRSVLRQSPDVIMIGEVRDPETADIAVRAANSGQLVLATIHAPTASGAVQSMRALGVHPHFLSTALRGTVSQRLVRTLCPKCKTSFDLSVAPQTFDDVRPWLADDEGRKLYSALGCDACENTGYASRVGVFEIMPVSQPIRALISDNRPTREIRVQAAQEKMLEFRQAALLKVALGATSIEEVLRVLPSEQMNRED
jgi:general secretion pathway protein E